MKLIGGITISFFTARKMLSSDEDEDEDDDEEKAKEEMKGFIADESEESDRGGSGSDSGSGILWREMVSCLFTMLDMH